MLLLNLGSITAYINIFTDVLSSVGGSIIPAGAEPKREYIMIGKCRIVDNFAAFKFDDMLHTFEMHKSKTCRAR